MHQLHPICLPETIFDVIVSKKSSKSCTQIQKKNIVHILKSILFSLRLELRLVSYNNRVKKMFFI